VNVEHTAGTKTRIEVTDHELGILVAALNGYIARTPQSNPNHGLAVAIRDNLNRNDLRYTQTLEGGRD